jgi:serine/threonine protein kinase/tetratricopeptide (TPR) repeat protein
MAEPTLNSGTLISHYRIASRLGAGGMGEVYLAHDTRLGRQVALKLLPTEFSQDKKRLGRFKQEACAASALNHPNIITIHEISEADDIHFIATEFIDGVTLRERLKDKEIKIETTLDVAIQVAHALAGAHAAGIVHRDIKPENIMLRHDGYVKVVDFGLAKLTEKLSGQQVVDPEAQTHALIETDAGTIMGTAYYMSPEQTRGHEVDTRTDIWSLGCVLYEMLTGQTPFTGPTKSDVVAAILTTEPDSLSLHMSEVPSELQRIITKALAKEKNERYQTIKDMTLDLRRLKEELEFERKLVRASSGKMFESTRSQMSAAETIIDAPPVSTEGAQPRTRETAQAGSSIERLITSAKHRKKTVAGIFALTIVAGLAYFLLVSGNYFQSQTKTINSIAIMPFANVGADPHMEYLSDGITDSLINSLSQLPNLKVMSRNSVFRYKGREMDAQQIARQLNVRAVLTGRVIQQGDSLAISVALVDASDNTHIWGEQYKRQFSDIFVVQEEMAREISEKLRLKLTGEEQKLLTKRYTDNTEAYQLYLKGNYYWNKFTPEAERTAIDYYTQAIVKDPNYSLAYGGLVHGYQVSANNGWMRPHDAYPKAKAAVAKALELDPNNVSAQTAFASTAMFYDWDWATAEKGFKRANEIEPNYWHHHELYAYLLTVLGRADEAIREAQRAQEIDPLSLIAHASAGEVLYRARQYDRAIEEARKALALDPGFAVGHIGLARNMVQQGKYEEAIAEYKQAINLMGRTSQLLGELGRAYALSGKRSEALKLLEELKDLSARQYISPLDFAFIYMGLGDREQAFVYLEKAYQERSTWLMWIKVDPRFDPLRSDPRFADLLRRMNLSS